MWRYFQIFIVASTLVLMGAGFAVGAEPLRVRCEASPLNGMQSLDYEAAWTSPAETEDYLVGFAADASYDPAGNICIVDYQQKNIVRFDAGGNWAGTIGREGEGPGEVREARKLFLHEDTYGLLQGYPAAIVWLHPDGSPAGRKQIGNQAEGDNIFIAAASAMQAGSRIFVWINRMHYADEEIDEKSWITTVSADGQLGSVLYSPPEQPNARTDSGIDESLVYDIWLNRWTGDNTGGVWVAPERDRYILEYWNAHGELELELTREYEPVVRSEEGAGRIVAWFKRRGWATEQIQVGKTAPVVQDLRVSDAGNLWVGLDRGGGNPESDVVRVYDVFSRTGQYLKRISFVCGLDLHSLALLSDYSALALTTDDDGEQMVALLRVQEMFESN